MEKGKRGFVPGAVFSSSIAFLFMGLTWRVCSGLPAFVTLAIVSILVAALYGSLTIAAKLNWPAVSCGSAVGVVMLGVEGLAHGGLPLVAETALRPIVLSVIATAIALRLPARHARGARFVAAVHTAQGVFLLGLLLPVSLMWEWPRPYAAFLIVAAFGLWYVWGDCPLNIAENTLRLRQGRAPIPEGHGFTSHLLSQWGLAVSDKTITTGLYSLGVSLCGWWTIEYAMF